MLLEDFKGAIQECPTYICDICWKFEIRMNVIKLKELKYQTDICNKCTTSKLDWIVKSVTILWQKIKMPMSAQLNKMELQNSVS